MTITQRIRELRAEAEAKGIDLDHIDSWHPGELLIQIGTEEVRLRNLADGREFSQKQLEEILGLLESLDKYARALRRHGGDFSAFVDRRGPNGDLPTHLVKVREGNNETVHYFLTEEELARFSEENPDLRLSGRE